MADADFDEEEVWAVMRGTGGGRDETSSSLFSKRGSSKSTLSSAAQHGRSAPLNIPDWSKIRNAPNCDDDDDDEDKAPPHEWLAKKMSRTQISSFSVCEGAGRKLKGRDLSKVRNAVLVKTGFIETVIKLIMVLDGPCTATTRDVGAPIRGKTSNGAAVVEPLKGQSHKSHMDWRFSKAKLMIGRGCCTAHIIQHKHPPNSLSFSLVGSDQQPFQV